MSGDGVQSEIYPAGPRHVPPDLTKPTSAYRRHAYLAFFGLLTFVALYLALAGWFAWMAYRLLSALQHDPNGWLAYLVGGGGAAFLAIFMLKAMIFVRRGKHGDHLVEVTANQHPKLFEFLHRVADEARAPRPYRVYLSPQVNAGVFYDLSLLNLLLPSKKNIEIGLGLVNVLTLGELKAVLAHEFGHFAQRTMAVGRWVYIGQQIAGHIVVKRDALDRALQVISSWDLRIAWVGWTLRLIVWSIRSLVDTAFRWVVLAQRALSREMELQADLVAVSLTGSDALVHALHRLEAADDAMDRAFAFAASQRAGGKQLEDIFAIQNEMLARKRAILDDPQWGAVPALPAAAPELHRVFQQRIAQPPRMWSTHPPNELREANCKKVYVPCSLDDRSGWLLFTYPGAVKKKVTAQMYTALATASDDEQPKELEPITTEVALAVLDERFDRYYLDPSYRGVYLGRSVVRSAPKLDALYGSVSADTDLVAALDRLYPPTLTEELERMRDLQEEKALLEALQRGFLEAPGGVIRHRGNEVRRRELPALVDKVERELVAARDRVEAHDREVRAVHYAIAQQLGGGWAAYHRALVQTMHYADHRQFDLDDAAGVFQNVLSIVLADRKVTEGEALRAVDAGSELHGVLAAIFSEALEVELPPILRGELDLETSWIETLGPFELPPPHLANIGDWIGAAMSYVDGLSGLLGTLYTAALNELLRVERELARLARCGEPAPEAPPVPRMPARYPTRLDFDARPRQERLGWWDRFQVADGFIPATLRFAVAGAIVGTVLYAGRGL